MIKNLVFITGDEAFLISEKKQFYKKAFLSKFEDGLVETLSGEEGSAVSLSDLQARVLTPSLFGGKHLIFLENFWTPDLFESAEKINFFESIENAADFCTVICVEPILDKRVRWVKFFLGGPKKESAGRLEKLDPLSPQKLKEWVLQNFEKQGRTISNSVCDLLLLRTGGDMWTIHQEILKLSLHEESTISKAAVESLVRVHPQMEIWTFLEAMSKGQTLRAIKSFRTLMNMGENPYAAIALIQRETRVHWMLLLAHQLGLSAKEIASQTKLHPFVVQKTLPLSKNFTQEKIKGLYEFLYNLDRKIKTGQFQVSAENTGEIELEIERFVVMMSRASV